MGFNRAPNEGSDCMQTNEMNKEYIQLIENDREKTLRDVLAFKKTLKLEADSFNTNPVEFAIVPKFFNQQIREDFRLIAETMYQILIKVIDRYISDEAYRKLFEFDPLLEQLICSDCGYGSLLPIVRIDLFYNEQTKEFTFCECNTDGSSGMAEEMGIAQGMAETEIFGKFTKGKQTEWYDLFAGLIDAFLNIYEGYDKGVENPVIAIVDFLESGVSNEFEAFREKFEERGYKAIIADIRELEYKNKLLYHNEIKIDAIYRRAVTGEIMMKKDTCLDFIQSILDDAVCVIGHPRTQIAHVKLLFVLLMLPETQAFLTDVEIEFIQAHIPLTTRLRSGNYNYNQVLLDKDAWVIKPSDMYASKNVCVGKDMTEEQWEAAFQKGIQSNYLLQAFCEPYHTQNAYFDEDEQLVVDHFRNITGLYVYNGKFSGVFSRISKRAIISSNYEGLSLGSIFVK